MPSKESGALLRVQEPALAVDRRQRIVFANAAMAELLGVDGRELRRRTWPSGCVSRADRAAALSLMQEALRGSAREGAVVLAARGDRAVAACLDLRRFGRGESAGVLVVVRDTRTRRKSAVEPCDAWCEVSRGPAQPAKVRSLRFLDPSAKARRYVGRPLAELLDAVGAHGA